MKKLGLRKDISHSVRRGHPWVFRDALRLPQQVTPESGELVQLVGKDRGSLGYGYFDADSPIALRMLGRSNPDVPGRMADALRLRTQLALDSNAVRLFHGEGDALPGLVVDYYDGFGVVRCDGAAAELFYEPYLKPLRALAQDAGFGLQGLWRRSNRRGKLGEGLIWGQQPPPAIDVREGLVRFAVDPVKGHKTGFFLDQKRNRARVGVESAGARVLDLFCFTGGFGVSAAVGGAAHVTLVDAAKPAIRFAERNMGNNQIDSRAFEVHQGDVFAFLDKAHSTGQSWDLIVCDPPSFAPAAAARPQALAAYQRLQRACLRLLPPGGLLATASCSSHITRADLLHSVGAAAAELERSVAVVHTAGASPDHPVNPAFPEGDYLCFALVVAR